MPTGAPDVAALLTTAGSNFQANAMDAISAIFPVILAVVGLVILIRFAIKMFKKVGG